MKIALFFVSAILTLIIVTGVYVFIIACVRKKEISWLDSEAIKGTGYERFGGLILKSYEWICTHKHQDVFVDSSDGLRLHGLWIPADNAKGTILLAHGYNSTILVDFGKAMELYHDTGFNLLVPDQRCHGRSQGRIITFGVKESDDMLHWINYHNEHFGNYQMVLSGLSMGASTMMYLADHDLPDNVKGIIVDCGFTSPAEIISVVFKRKVHLPAYPAILATDLVARVVSGFSLFSKDSRRTLRNNKLPILMIHGKEDDFVPCSMTEQAYTVCSGDKQLLLVENAGHGLSFLHAPEKYIELVQSFLKRNIEGI